MENKIEEREEGRAIHSNLPGDQILSSSKNVLKRIKYKMDDRSFSTSAGEDPQIQNSNLPREYIRKFFPERKCFVFDRPINDKKLLQHIEEASEDQLELDFREQSKNFCSYIFAKAKTKTLREGITVTGNRESLLLQVPLWGLLCDEAVIALWVCQ